MPDEVDELRDLPDPVERAKRVGELIGRYQARLAELARMRREAIDDLRAHRHGGYRVQDRGVQTHWAGRAGSGPGRLQGI